MLPSGDAYATRVTRDSLYGQVFSVQVNFSNRMVVGVSHVHDAFYVIYDESLRVVEAVKKAFYFLLMFLLAMSLN